MIFEVQDVHFTYPGASQPALDSVGLKIPAGETTAVLGLSGSGKTTLLNLLGLLWEAPLLDGSICYYGDGEPRQYADLTPRVRSELRLNDFGFVLQRPYLLPHFTSQENISLPLKLKGEPATRSSEEVQRLLKAVGLYEKRDSLARELSGGELQRVALLRAIVHDPRIVFADEPVSNLDFVTARQILTLLRCWRRGTLHTDGDRRRRALVLVSHSVETAFRIARHFVVLRHGKLVCSLAKQDLEHGQQTLYDLIEKGK